MTDIRTIAGWDRHGRTRPRFSIGQSISYRSSSRGLAAASGRYRVVGVRPAEEGELFYRIKGDDERHERIARESELSIVG
jgi:hypothetical protein